MEKMKDLKKLFIILMGSFLRSVYLILFKIIIENLSTNNYYTYQLYRLNYLMGNDAQFMQMLKIFSDTIKDLTSVIGPLPQSIASLSNQIPRITDIESRLKLVESNIILSQKTELESIASSDEVKELRHDLIALTADVLARMKRIEDIYAVICKIEENKSEKEKDNYEIKKQELILKETTVKEINETERAKINGIVNISLKIIAGLGTITLAIIGFIQFIFPLIQKSPK